MTIDYDDGDDNNTDDDDSTGPVFISMTVWLPERDVPCSGPGVQKGTELSLGRLRLEPVVPGQCRQLPVRGKHVSRRVMA